MRSASAKRQGLQEADIDAAIDDFETSARFSAAEKLALRYSQWMALDPDRLDRAFYDALRGHYSEPEIVELGAFIGFNIGYHTFFGTLKFYPMFAPDGRLVSQEESARIYGAVPVSLESPASANVASHTIEDPPAESAATRHPDESIVARHPGETIARHPGESRDPGDAPRESIPISAGMTKGNSGTSKAEPAAAQAPHVRAIPSARIGDPDLSGLVEQCLALGVPDATFPGILAHSPIHAKAVLRALLLSHTAGNFDHRLKEIIRVQLARTAGDRYFARLRSKRAQQSGLEEASIESGAGAFETDPRFTDAEKWALRYARELYRNPETIDAACYAEGKRHYSEAQIMELGAFAAFHYGMQVFARTLAIPGE